jgi:enterochelin esterase-like enzyme
MHFGHRHARPVRRAVARLACLLIASCYAFAASAATLTLKDGSVVHGTVDQQGNIVRVDDGLRHIVFGTKRLSHVDADEPFAGFKPFRIAQPLSGRNLSERVDNLISIVKITPFDEFGQRTLSVRDPLRGQVDILQGITEVGPEFIRVQSLRQLWESSIATNAVPADTIAALLRRSIDEKNVDDRLRLTRFFLAVEWYTKADKELRAIEQEFPAVKQQVREAAALLEQLKAQRLLQEIKLRRTAGQHAFAYQALRDFATDGAAAEVLSEVRDLVKQYDGMIERMQQVERELERLYGEVKNAELAGKLSGPLGEIAACLHVENLGRLESFLNASANPELAAEDRLALAVSGWVAGSAFAEAKLERALRLWEARDKIEQCVAEASEVRRERLVAELRAKEISADVAAGILELMPPVLKTDDIEPGKPKQLTIHTGGDDIAYSVLLPAEYNPFHRYPVLITLHGQAMNPEQEIAWWSSPPGYQASRHGYIVVAPAYVKDPARGYRFDSESHNAVLYALIDVRRRFSVDSDRVFLTGHSMGGHAAWDIGLAHPDLFAGVAPICGSPQFFCEPYWPNAEHAALYVVDGEKNGQSPASNTALLERMMANGYDAVYTEFKGRGHENFSDQTLPLFDWMSRKTRSRFPLSFSCRSARPTDNEFYWLSVDEFVPEVMMDPRVFDRKKVRPAQLEAKITGTSNTIQLSLRGPKKAELWLSPQMVDFDQPVTVRVNGELKHRKPITPDLAALLEDFRVRADRQKLFYARMSFPRL